MSPKALCRVEVCPNGQIFLLAVTLAYAREQLLAREVAQAQARAPFRRAVGRSR